MRILTLEPPSPPRAYALRPTYFQRRLDVSTAHEDSARQRLVQLFLLAKYRFFVGALVIGTTPERGRQDEFDGADGDS
jgi:hypothetical protein